MFHKNGKAHLTDIHKTEADSQPSWDKFIVLGPWVRPESPVCHRVHLCSQQHSWARNQHLLTAATTDGLSPNKLLLPPLLCLRSSFTDLYGQILTQAPRWMDESARQLNFATRSEYCLCAASWGACTPVCSAAMLYRDAWATPLLAQHCRGRFRTIITWTMSRVPQILVRDCRAWLSHTNPCSSGRSSQCRLRKGSLACVTHRKKGKIWIPSDIWGHCSNNLPLVHLVLSEWHLG